ncbi:alkene reductase [Flavobacterium zepuense]|uniref:Alkene reductase n=1 Tax=Flavobacterium zepuense TaxID=2593302 RepID=A0A552VAB1_9FLAO|nr:alkene reductase [Flavobacterium zepuense]TRW27379.1 alkene reductase [Flavobacterium zepuense]
MLNSAPNLFASLNADNLKLKNRIVMAPMTRSRAIGNVPNDLMAQYYVQRASAGLIITEGTAPSPNALGYPRIPGIFDYEQLEGWKKVTEAVHEKGGKIIMQLMHVGRIGNYENMPEGTTLVAPSAINADAEMFTDAKGLLKTNTPKELDLSSLHATIEEFVIASKNAISAGFDGVELHGANGYLLEQFLNPHTNTRTDEYGGSIENRCRFVIEVTQAVAEAIGSKRVGIRFSPYGIFNSMPKYDEVYTTYEYLAKEMNKLNILYLHVVDAAARQSQEGIGLISAMRGYFTGLLILNGGYTGERATAAIESREADMVSFGSLFIANPDLPYRLEHDKHFTQPDEATFYTPGEKGYTDYPLYKE